VKEHFGCPVQATSNILAGKWKVLIVWHLSFGPRRFAEIRDILPGVTEKMLAAQLRQLEADGIVSRTVSADVPLRVEYRLTAAGEDMIPVMEIMYGWGIKHMGIDPKWPRPSPSAPAPPAGLG
jgi:DNA-binding HxlR family transcriptional regulator